LTNEVAELSGVAADGSDVIRRWWAPGLCALVLVSLVLDLRLQPGGERVTRGVDDIVQLAAAGVASAAALWRAARVQGRLRASWALIAAGAGCWAVGEVVWSYYELVAGVSTPFPSLADVGYLLFPALTAVGIVMRSSRAFLGRGWARVSLDVVLIVVSLFTFSWATALGEVYRGGADSTLGTAVALAYPGSDVALLTVVVVVLTYASAGGRLALGWVGAGLVAFAVADSGFAYLTAQGVYRTGNLIDACWVGGFLVLACGAVFDSASTRSAVRGSLTPRSALLLPYLPAGVGIVAALWGLHESAGGIVLTVAAAGMVWLLVARQVLVLLDNRTLMVRITHQALHDALTGLGNRALFGDRLEHALELHRRDLRAVSLLLIDLDDFKTVNDSLGHPAGDELLIRVSERLRACVRGGDTVARLGGDEFAVLIEDDGDPFMVADRIQASLEQAVVLGHRPIPVGASIGLASLLSQDRPTSAAEMFRQADVALYAAKRNGKRGIAVFSPELGDLEGTLLDLRTALASDLGAGRIDVALQPIQRSDGQVFGYEALARWTYQDASVPPSTFLPIAAGLGAAAKLDEIVMRKAISEAIEWTPGVMLSVNFAGHTLADSGFSALVARVLTDTGYPPGQLMVEVLESSLVEHDQLALRTLADLRRLGVLIAVDDFGAGYASIARLHALQPDIIKIDRSLISAHDASQTYSTLLNGTVQLAHQFSALVIAEGIETAPQLSAAITAGCDAMQGYLLGRPTISVHTGILDNSAA
jgi:diguanylate cyclase (GGDEF)-like protein